MILIELVLELSTIGEKAVQLLCTKRNILKIGASFFDPLGLICPVVLQIKLLFKEICGIKIDWDTVIHDALSSRWQIFLNDLISAGEIRLPRYIHNKVRGDIVSFELHGFADSSKEAYAALVYLRVMTSSRIFQTSLVSAKSKIAPAKIKTIPRLELMSCLLLSKLIYSVKEASTNKYCCLLVGF